MRRRYGRGPIRVTAFGGIQFRENITQPTSVVTLTTYPINTGFPWLYAAVRAYELGSHTREIRERRLADAIFRKWTLIARRQGRRSIGTILVAGRWPIRQPQKKDRHLWIRGETRI